jgi:hypothetical protein
MKKIITAQDSYESPRITVEKIENEGFLCSSGTHEALNEDDSWIEYLE